MPDGKVGERKVYKDKAVESLDRFFSGPNAQALNDAFAYARGILDDQSQSLAELTEREFQHRRPGGVELDQKQVQHFKNPRHWSQEVQDEMRRGYREAIDLATNGEPLPIETFWVTGPNDRYQIIANRGERQVTVLVFIPPAVEAAARDQWD